MQSCRNVIKIGLTLLLFTTGCSKLKEDFNGDLTSAQVAGASGGHADILLQSLYNNLEIFFTDLSTYFPLQEFSTDEAIAPTRGTDWDDNGQWREIHQQKWLPANPVITGCFKGLNGISFASTDLLRYNPTKQQIAEARFIRAFAMYLILDLFDQVPYRDPGESLALPARVREGADALNYIISEIIAVQNDLPTEPVYKANVYAADVLLMKCYLNKAVYENRMAPEFDPADMNQVAALADHIITSGKFSLADNYFDNFAPGNSDIGKENIFTLLNTPGSTPGNRTFFYWIAVLHYNQAPAANGWATLSDFYKRFESTDKRRGIVYNSPGAPPNPANEINVGFLIGPQFDYFTGSPVFDRTMAQLSYTPEVKNIETGTNLESTGIRPIKYFPDWLSYFSPDNDFVFFRFSDVLLMKAEAIARGAAGTSAGSYGNTETAILNSIRTHVSRQASALASATPDDIYNERGRELWWESWRRQDMIRFEKFLSPFQEKSYQSDPKYLLFPIPDDQVAANRNLHQNPGY